MKPRPLANENFPPLSIRLFRDQGYDVAAVAEGAGCLADPDVLALAVAEKRWIVTFNRNYGELIFARGLPAPSAVVLFRMRSCRLDDLGRVFAGLRDSVPDFDGQFVLVEEAGLWIRPLPEQKPARG
jgi:predicted nuclease of predicted toxin-antitoxin system